MKQESKQPLTIYDISKKAGVSIATVSRVLNKSNQVKIETKERVLQVIEECGYTPNVFARGLGLNSMKTIGILCADSSDIYLAKAVYYIEERLRLNQYDSILCCTGYNLDDKIKSINLLISKKVDAIVLIGSNFLDDTDSGNDYIRNAADTVPVMFLNASFAYQNVYSVFCDDQSSMALATTELLNRGRRKPLYLYNSNSYSGKKKLEGYKSALSERGIKVNPKLIAYYEGGREDIGEIVAFMDEIYSNGVSFDSVICSEDVLALAAVKFAKEKQLEIPKDLSIIGYNNSILTQCSEPELSSVDNKLETLCKQLVTVLLGVLDGKDVPTKSEYSGELVLRKTT